jgi:hypothetical protein
MSTPKPCSKNSGLTTYCRWLLLGHPQEQVELDNWVTDQKVSLACPPADRAADEPVERHAPSQTSIFGHTCRWTLVTNR